ncbi:hypothetical protein ACLMNJ_27340 [Streptomyces seoulensis]
MFSLRELLAECTTSPEWTGERPEVDAEWAPRRFDSALLGGPGPHTSVLLLTGYLAATGLPAELAVESHDGFVEMVVACGGRRFQLVRSQDDWIAELGVIPGCDRFPVAEALIPYCEHRHLVERPETELAKMAWAWGNDRRQKFESTPAAANVGDQGDALIAAAAVPGAFSKVAARLIEDCFGDPDLTDDIFPGEATAIRHAMDNEHLLLKQRAWAAAHIRKLAGGLCTCGEPLYLGLEADVPARATHLLRALLVLTNLEVNRWRTIYRALLVVIHFCALPALLRPTEDQVEKGNSNDSEGNKSCCP